MTHTTTSDEATNPKPQPEALRVRSRRSAAKDSAIPPTEPAKSPLELDGWITWNCERWNLRPFKLDAHADGAPLPAIAMNCFLDPHGRICSPPLAPYLPILFHATPTHSQQKSARQWIDLSEALVKEISRIGLANFLLLPPEVTDARAWQWAGYPVLVRYTYCLDFPYDLQQVDRSVRNRCNHAAREYICRRADSMKDVVHCLNGTTERHELPSRLSSSDLDRLAVLIGHSLRAYVCYDSHGAPVSTQVALFTAGTRALDWLAGTITSHLNSGVAQLLTLYMLDDLQASGASGIDLVGANVRGVAIAKSKWNGTLIPFYRIEAPGFKRVLQSAREWITYCRHRHAEKVQAGIQADDSLNRL